MYHFLRLWHIIKHYQWSSISTSCKIHLLLNINNVRNSAGCVVLPSGERRGIQSFINTFSHSLAFKYRYFIRWYKITMFKLFLPKLKCTTYVYRYISYCLIPFDSWLQYTYMFGVCNTSKLKLSVNRFFKV